MRRLGIGLLLIFLAYLATGFTPVRPGERAVVRRFGRIVAKPGPGLYIGWPMGIERVDRVAVDQLQRVRVGYLPETDQEGLTPPGQLLTGDHNLVNVLVLLDYAIDPEQVDRYVINAERVEGLVARTAEAALAEWVAGHGVDEVLLRAKSELPAWLLERTQARLNRFELGVDLRAASIGHLYPPEEVKSAFDDVSRAQTAIRTREHEARQEAARRLRAAEAEALRIERTAAAYHREQQTLARADAENFERRLRQFQQLGPKNPHFLAGLWWEEMGQLFTRLKEKGRIDLLDEHLGADGLDITITPALPKK